MTSHPSALSRAVQVLAILLAIAGVGWAVLQGFLTLAVLGADDFPQCTDVDPDKTVLVLLALSAFALAVTSAAAAIEMRLRTALICVAAESPVVVAWFAADGARAAGCLIG